MLSAVQQIFGGGQTYRLVQVRMEHHLFDDRLELAYGRLTATADFLSSPFYCQFVNNGICGQPPAPFFNMPTELLPTPRGRGAVWCKCTLRKTPTQSLRFMTAIPTTAMTLPSMVQTLDGVTTESCS